MERLRVLAFGTLLVWAHPGVAEPGSIDEANKLPSMARFSGEPPAHFHHRGFAFPVIEYTDPTGVRQQQRGVLASKRIAAGTLMGVGLYETAPKHRDFVPEVNPNPASKRKRLAAVGLSWKF
ncbi:hypothetical protein LZ016_01965 [Sphingomonas sp. SM33]|uniref:Uncharacterized protein n=1 Tax=Sphingomonas telluris TaxID=2907998 RepID=A0ABS9VIS4_9SPHN|nr:hypothetical protein [Sphingomonas telluris]MCH8614872.1 hypothetical protein [Sphingomonas telluris]